MRSRVIYIGFDPREAGSFAVTRASLARFNRMVPVRGLVLETLRRQQLYYRPTERRDGRLWDVISGAPMATEFAISRFLVPELERRRAVPSGKWAPDARSALAMFMDCDMLARANPEAAFALAEAHPEKAVFCVHHNHRPPEGVKMDGQMQTVYARKNWSSVMIFNCAHPSNAALTVDLVNSVPGRDLHRFCWLKDDEIGELGPEWNFLVGHTDPAVEPKIVHFTEGTPEMPGYEDCAYADEWRAELCRWAC